jgi:hypothetical protein
MGLKAIAGKLGIGTGTVQRVVAEQSAKGVAGRHCTLTSDGIALLLPFCSRYRGYQPKNPT